MINYIAGLGRRCLNILERLGRGYLFLTKVLAGIPSLFYRLHLVIQQLHSIGVSSVLVITASGLFVGMVLSLQSYYVLVDYGAEESMGMMVSLSLIREFGPVVSALLFSGCVGSALTAEIGLMKSTEQLSGMEMMAVDPIWRIIAPRFLAGFIVMPLLAVIFSVAGIIGAFLIGHILLGIDDGSFWYHIQVRTDWYNNILIGVTKGITFGFVIMWISLYEGYDAFPTSEGVGQATTRTVAHSAFAILGLDLILTALMFGEN